MRMIIDVPDALLNEVDALAQRENISPNEVVTRALSAYLAERSASHSDNAFGIWKSKQVDPLDAEDLLRGEWNR
jgi:metal-responsive CopG/Arc/MetJ family transcriptional regulator